MIRFGTCKSIDGARVRVVIPGFEGDAGIDCMLMQPCAQGPSVWMPPAVGDVVVVAVDTERLDDSVVLGVVYPDGKLPPKTGNSEAAMQYESVYIGDPVPDTKCPRDDLVQSQLAAIKSELDSFASAFNAHNHTVVTVTAVDAAAIVAAATSGAPATTSMQTGTPTAHAQGYSVGDTASDCVYVR